MKRISKYDILYGIAAVILVVVGLWATGRLG
jgi:hypothetical protein